MKIKSYNYQLILIISLLGLLITNCSTGVEPSPSPGIVKVTFMSAPEDTSVIILSDTSRFWYDSTGNSIYDQMTVIVTQARLYRNQNFANLYLDLSNRRIAGDTLNAIQRINYKYTKHTIFETYIAPGEYDRLEMNLEATLLVVTKPKYYFIPMALPDGVSKTITIPANISVKSNKTTTVDIIIYPFRSLGRYKDMFIFSRDNNIYAQVHNP